MVRTHLTDIVLVLVQRYVVLTVATITIPSHLIVLLITLSKGFTLRIIAYGHGMPWLISEASAFSEHGLPWWRLPVVHAHVNIRYVVD